MRNADSLRCQRRKGDCRTLPGNENRHHRVFYDALRRKFPEPLCLTLPRKYVIPSEKVLLQADVNVSAIMLKDSALRLELVREGKVVRAQEIKPLSGNHLIIQINLSGLETGEYALRGTILGSVPAATETAAVRLNIIQDPLDF